MNKNVYAAGAILLLSGCFTYVPVQDAVPERGREVKTSLQPRDLDMGTFVVRDINVIEGTVFRSTEDSVAVSSKWLYNLQGNRYFANGAIYHFTRDDLDNLSVRKLQPTQTVVAVAGLLAAGAGIFTFVAEAGGTDQREPGGGDIQTRIVFPIP